MNKRTIGWTAIITINLVSWCMLGFYGNSQAAPAPARQPFGNAVEQRQEMIRELRDIRTLLKEQNTLLRTVLLNNARHDPQQP